LLRLQGGIPEDELFDEQIAFPFGGRGIEVERHPERLFRFNRA
jgi:hypothetical protein